MGIFQFVQTHMDTNGHTNKDQNQDSQTHRDNCGHKQTYPDTNEDTLINTETHGHKQKHINIQTKTYTERDTELKNTNKEAHGHTVTHRKNHT